jgi:hypothetical protein
VACRFAGRRCFCQRADRSAGGRRALPTALAEHRRVVRETFARYQGYEGDAFFYAFGSVTDAVAAVTEAKSPVRANQRPCGHAGAT